MSGSCHLDRASNVEIGVECQMFVIVIFFNCGQALQFGAHSRYYKGALTQKRSFLVICTTFRSDFHVGWKNQNKHSTLNLSFDALSKWHEPDIRKFFWWSQDVHRRIINLLLIPLIPSKSSSISAIIFEINVKFMFLLKKKPETLLLAEIWTTQG